MSTVHPVDLTDDAAFAELYDVYARSYTRAFDCPWLAVEKRVNLTDDAYGAKVAVIARDRAGSAVGGGTVTMPRRDNVQIAFIDVFVLPEHRRHGIGSAVLDELMAVGRQHDRSSAFAMPAWGVGVDDDPAQLFAVARGFALEQMDAVRELALPTELPPLVVDPAYSLQTWRGPCPEEWITQYAELRRILTQEAPNDAGLENEHWDAARVRTDEADLVRVGREMQVVVARAANGELAGHTQLAFPSDRIEVYQWDTLARPAHRGHGLGLALKIRAMQASTDLLEGRRRITTENAASNSYMIAVNEKLGFRQTAWTGEYVRPI